MKGGKLEGERVFGDLWILEFDAGRSVDAATRTLANVCIRVRRDGFVGRVAALGIGGGSGIGIAVGIYIGNNRKDPACSDPDAFCRNLKGGIDSVTEECL
jgi:hypothetical protein